MVPRGWKKKSIGNLCEFVNGNGFKASEWSDKGLPIIRIQNLNGSREFNYFSGKPNSSWIVMPGQLLFAWAGTKGVSFGPTIWNGPKGVLNQHIYKVKVTEEVDSTWFYKTLIRATDLIERRAHGFKATLVHVKKSDITDQIVLVPKRSEQTKISQILSTWDKAIETTEKLIANSKAQKNVLMQQLLTGKKRFPGFVKLWHEVSIKKMGRVVSGGTPDTDVSDYWNGNVLWATPTDITTLKSQYISDTKRKITIKGLKESSASLLPPRSILVCTRATVGELAIAGNEITTNQGFKSLILSLKYDSDFIYYLFQFFKNVFVKYACGSTFLELSKKDFERLNFIVPELSEQTKIAQTLNAVSQEIYDLKILRERLKTEKAALMQQLLTGKRRVKLTSAA